MLYLIGVNHKAQYGTDAVLSARLIKHVRKVVADIKVECLCEELSEDDIEALGFSSSIIERLAEELGLEYIACDPTDAERSRLGIKTGQEIALKMAELQAKALDSLRGIGAFPQKEFDKFQADIQKNERQRERYWLNKIKNKKDTVLVFICGAGHISMHPKSTGDGFELLLQKNGWEVNICPIWFE